jgi:glycosyltransferase involved in cell wall biosynthesis
VILHVVAAAQRRGAETFAVDLAAALAGRDLPSEVVAVAPGPADGALDVEVLGPSALAPSTLRALRRRAAGAEVVVAHGSRSLPACALALALPGRPAPAVYRSIGDPAAWAGGPVRRRRSRLLLGRMAAVTALWPGAKAALARLYGLGDDRVVVIPNAVPAARCPQVGPEFRAAARARLGLPAEAPVVAYLGALRADKGVAAAVEAVAARPDVHLIVGGDGPERAALAAQAAASAPGRVQVLGPVADPAAVLAPADLVVLPSRTEGMPGVLIEAALCGVGAVATDVGGVGEIVVDGVTGILVPADGGDADEPGALAAAVGEALDRALPRAADLGRAARRHCLAAFEIGPVADRWAALLRSLRPV